MPLATLETALNLRHPKQKKKADAELKKMKKVLKKAKKPKKVDFCKAKPTHPKCKASKAKSKK